MKKFAKWRAVLFTVLLLSLSMLFVACNKDIVISFETNGGTEIESMVVDDDFEMPSNPTKSGYVFDGWYTDKDLTQPFKVAEISKYTESFTIYAKWRDEQTTLAKPENIAFEDNVVTWGAVDGEGSEISYFVSVDGGTAMEQSATSFNMGFYADGQHTVSVYAALANNSAVRSEAVTTSVTSQAAKDDLDITENTGLYYRVTEDGERAYVFLTNSEIGMGSTEWSATGNLVSEKTDGTNGFIVGGNVGSFDFTITENGQPNTYKAYVRPNVKTFSVDNQDSFNQRATYYRQTEWSYNDSSYFVGVGNAFRFNITATDVLDESISNFSIPLVYTVKNGGVVVDEGAETYQLVGNSIDFAEEMIGKTVTVEILPKYYIERKVNQIAPYSINVTLTDGVNVYDNEGFKEAFGDLSVNTINVHSNITVEYNDKQVYETQLNGKDVAKHIHPQNITADNWDENANVYVRFGNAVQDNFTINGNYFNFNAANLPLLQKDEELGINSAGSGLGYLGVTDMGAYSQQSAIFCVTYRNSPDAVVNISNLTLRGNLDLESEPIEDPDASAAFILEQSGALHGFVANGCTVEANNIMQQNNMQAWQIVSNDEISVDSTTKTQLNMHYCSTNNSFYSSVYGWGSIVKVDHSYFGNSGAASINMPDRHNVGKQPDDNKKGFPFDPELYLDASNVFENWVVGTEPYYATVEGLGAAIVKLKAELNAPLSSQMGVSVLKQRNGEAFNFIFMNNGGVSEDGYARIKMVFTDMDSASGGDMTATAQNTVYRDANYTNTNSDDKRVELLGNELGISDTFLAPLSTVSTKEAYNQYYSVLSGMSMNAAMIYGSTWLENEQTAQLNQLYKFGGSDGRTMAEAIAGFLGAGTLTVIVEYGSTTAPDSDWLTTTRPAG